MKKTNGKKVAVLGAGVAGLTAALRLKEAGCLVTVYEGRDRVGGRIFTEANPCGSVEHGGTFVGSNHKELLALCAELGVKLTELEDEPRGLFNGEAVSDATRAALDAIYETIEEHARAIIGNNADCPWKCEDAHRLDQLDVASWMREVFGNCDIEAMKLFLAEFAADQGVGADDASTLGFLAMVRGGQFDDEELSYFGSSEDYVVEGGTSALIEALYQAVGPENVHLGHRVENVGALFRDYDAVFSALPCSILPKLVWPDELAGLKFPEIGTSTMQLATGTMPVAPSDTLGTGRIPETWEAARSDDNVVIACFGESHLLENPEAILPSRLDGFVLRDCRETEWMKSPFLSGGYSFPRPGYLTTHGERFRMGLPGRLHFVGEASSTEFPGYMNGGLESAEREVMSFLKAIS